MKSAAGAAGVAGAAIGAIATAPPPAAAVTLPIIVGIVIAKWVYDVYRATYVSHNMPHAGTLTNHPTGQPSFVVSWLISLTSSSLCTWYSLSAGL